jgi:1,4-alpha-glucan branching enzyme
MGLKKRYLKTKPVGKVTFKLPKEAARAARKVHVVGEFNDWDRKATPMARLKDGGFSVTLDLEPGREYRFRYLIDEQIWENDWEADKYEPSPYGAEDSVVVV